MKKSIKTGGNLLLFLVYSCTFFAQELVVECTYHSPDSISTSVVGGAAPFSYLWSDGDTMPHRGGLSAGLYTVTVTDDASCVNECGIYINDLMCDVSATFTVVPDTCGRGVGSIDLSPTSQYGIDQILWNRGDTVEDLTDVVAGSYTVQLIDSSGCDTVLVPIVVGDESLSISLAETIGDASCENNGFITLIATPNLDYTFEWSNGSTTKNIYAQPPGDHIVTVTYVGCTHIDTFTIVDDPDVSIACNVIGVDSIEAVVSGGVGPFSYLWNRGDTVANIGGLQDSLYSVTVTDVNDCTASCEVLIAIPDTCFNNKPSLSIVNDKFFVDSLITINVEPEVSGYSPTWSGDAPIIGSNTVWDIQVQVSDTGIYSMQLSITNGECTYVYNHSFEAVVDCNCTLDVTADQEICAGDSVDLVATVLNCSGVVVWSTGDTATTIRVAPTEETTYIASTSGDYCGAADWTVVSIDTTYNLTIVGDSILCEGDTITLTRVGDDDNAYWSTGSPLQSIQVTTGGTYTVTNVGADCPGFDAFNVTEISDIGFSIADTVSGCGSVQLGPYIAGDYAWSNGAQGDSITVYDAGDYYVTVTVNNCSYVDTVYADIDTSIYVAIYSDVGCDSTLVYTNHPGKTHSWSTGASTDSIYIYNNASYQVTVTEGGCTANSSKEIMVGTSATISLPDTVDLCEGQEYTLNTNLSEEMYEIRWFFAPTGIFSIPIGNGASHTFNATNDYGQTGYVVSVSDNYGCVTTKEVIINANKGVVRLFAWEDFNYNGYQDQSTQDVCLDSTYVDSGVDDGILYEIYKNGDVVAFGLTDSVGYAYNSLETGTYLLRVYPFGYNVTYTGIGSEDIDNDFSATHQVFFSIDCSDTVKLDLGLWKQGSIGDYVWDDTDEDGIQDGGEFGLSGMEIELIGENQTSSDANGAYSFTVDPGEYEMRIIDANGYLATTRDAGADDTVDSDISPFYETNQIMVHSGEDLTCVDMGLVLDCDCEIQSFTNDGCNIAWSVTGTGCSTVLVNPEGHTVGVSNSDSIPGTYNGVYELYVSNETAVCDFAQTTVAGCETYDICIGRATTPIVEGQDFTVTITVYNDSPIAATGIDVEFMYNDEQTYNSSSPTATHFSGAGNLGGGILRWSNLTVNASSSIDLTVEMSQDGDRSIMTNDITGADRSIKTLAGGNCDLSGG